MDGYDLETLVIGEIDFVDQYVPHEGGPTDPDPTDPDPTDPDPTDPDPTDPDPHGSADGGCSTGAGGASGLAGAVFALGLVARRRRR